MNLIYFDLFQDTEFHLDNFSKTVPGIGKLYNTYRYSVECYEKCVHNKLLLMRNALKFN